MIILANLDCEATWSGTSLPLRVQRRISAAAALLAAFSDRDAEVWAPAAVDPARLRIPVTMRVGTPTSFDLAWADPNAKAANDRRLALAVGTQLGVALPGACTIDSLDALDAAAAGVPRWVCKAPWTSAGRDRAHGEGIASGETRVYLGRLLERFGSLVFEPWLDRLFDLGVCATIDASGHVHAQQPHTLICDPRGGFVGIDLAPPPLTADERTLLSRAIAGVGRALANLRFTGPFTIDAFVYGPSRALHPLCEINARHSFGHIARALAARFETRILGFGPPPPDATMFIAAAADDPTTAWGAKSKVS